MAAVGILAGCIGSDKVPGVAPECRDSGGRIYRPCRVFKGRLKLPPAAQLLLESRPFQVAAVAFESTGDGAPSDLGPPAADGAPLSTASEPRFFFGGLFAQDAGGGQQPDTPFSIVVPCPLSVNLLLQVPRSSDGNVPGFLVAAMRFESGNETGSTTLIPRQPADLCVHNPDPQGFGNTIDLGQVALTLTEDGDLGSGEVVLGDSGCSPSSRNPLSLVDTDLDGETDLADQDDDDDGTPDTLDLDVEGDGIPDSEQLLTALPDVDHDGIPDLFD